MSLILFILSLLASHGLSDVSHTKPSGISSFSRIFEISTQIVGGISAREGQYPYIASLRFNNNHFCGGSVISKEWILTAAHCLISFNDTAITIVLGTNKLNKDGVKYSSIQTVVHPDYNSAFILNDIGLIKVDREIVFDEKVKSIDLPTTYFNKSNSLATLAGWGATKYPGRVSNDLQHINLTIIDQAECLKLSHDVTNNNICTLNKINEGACVGDSGGPLVVDNMQVGVVSWGIPCAKGYPDVFTRVYPYVNWIKDHVVAKDSKTSKNL